MKRILHVAEPFATGVLSFLLDITRKQVEKYEVFILYGIRPLTPANVEDLFDKRVHLIRMDSFHGALGTVIRPTAYLDVKRWYRKIKPDIVHLHSSASGFVGRWALPCRKVPVFYTPHGYSFLMKDGSRLKRGLFRLIEYVSAKRPSTTIACSEGEWKEALNLSNNATYVNNGINLAGLEHYVRPFTEIRKPIRVCTSGRILYQKNPKLFNDIAALMPEAEFTWIGEGELRTELTSPNIKVTGWVTREEALEILRKSDFFILPSLWEGLPISLLEAMYMKKVCLVSNVIGNRDVIHSGNNGLICNEAKDYAEGMNAVAIGKLDGFLLSESAHADVETNYNASLMAEKYDLIYNQTEQ